MSSSRSSAPDRVYVSTRVLLPVRVALRVLFRRVFTVPVRQEVPAVSFPRRSVFPLSSTWRVRLPFRLLVSPFGLLTFASPALVRVLPVHHLSKPHFSLLRINPMRALPPLAAHAPLHTRRNRRSRDAAASLHPFGSTRTSHTPHASATHAALPGGFHAPRISPALPSARAVVATPPPPCALPIPSSVVLPAPPPPPARARFPDPSRPPRLPRPLQAPQRPPRPLSPPGLWFRNAPALLCNS
jgi:hypothetical protein